MNDLRRYLNRRNNVYWYIGAVLPSGKVIWKSTKKKKKTDALLAYNNPPDNRQKSTNYEISGFFTLI